MNEVAILCTVPSTEAAIPTTEQIQLLLEGLCQRRGATVLPPKVCGRAGGYQFGSPDGFYSYLRYSQSLESAYVDGLSVTHGSPRHHIWTFAVGLSKDRNYPFWNCPCALYPGPAAPPFVGERYFCEAGDIGTWSYSQWYLDDPLWDSQGCVENSMCCDRSGPWFSTELNEETNDDIEVRWCMWEDYNRDDTGVQELELYVQ